jgi:hypothetical protein
MGIYVKHDLSSCHEKSDLAVTKPSISRLANAEVHDDDSFAAA